MLALYYIAIYKYFCLLPQVALMPENTKAWYFALFWTNNSNELFRKFAAIAKINLTSVMKFLDIENIK